MSDKDLSFYNKKERPWLTRLDRMAIVGHVTPTKARIWFRVKGPGNYLVALSEQPLHGTSREAPVKIDKTWQLPLEDGSTSLPLHSVKTVRNLTGATDFTAVVNATKLKANTVYHFGIYKSSGNTPGWELGYENPHYFRTFPKDTAGPWDVTFGLYSCHMPFDRNYSSKADASMWGLFRDELDFAGARFVIGSGDQVYVDGTKYLDIWAFLKKVRYDSPTVDDMVSWYRDIYRGYWGFPDLQEVYRRFPNYMTWDDHEIMDGWGSLDEDELSQKLDTLFRIEDKDANLELADAMFTAAKQVYGEYEHGHNPKTKPGVYDYTLSMMGADFFILDMRGHRDFNRADNAILGDEQHQRLGEWANGLRDASQRPGPIFVVSSVPVVHLKDIVSDMLDWLTVFGARDDVRDHWSHEKHGAEAKRLLDTLFSCARRTGRPLVILSGDVHIGGVFELFQPEKVDDSARVCQVTSSAITYAAVGPAKASLLTKAVARTGEIGACYDGPGCGYHFRNHGVFPQHNFGLLRYRVDAAGRLAQLSTELVGRSDDGRVKESARFDLLDLG